MVGMPYHLEKGPWLSVLEDYVNGDSDRSLDYLRGLRASRDGNLSDAGTSLVNLSGLNGDPDNETAEKRGAHLNKDWYGLQKYVKRPSWGPQPSFIEATLEALPVEVRDKLDGEGKVPSGAVDRAAVEKFATDVSAAIDGYDYRTKQEIFNSWPTTGFWFQYHGDVQTIMRETLIRAIEISRGLPHDSDDAAEPDRQLPIEFFWKCPQRWFEGWVCWRSDKRTGTGQVTVVLATPGSGKPVLESPVEGEDHKLNPTDSLWTPESGKTGPVTPPPFAGAAEQAPKGMWVVTHKDHAQLSSTPDEGATTSGLWTIPSFGPTYVGVGSVVTVAPSEIDGGVRPRGQAIRVWINNRGSGREYCVMKNLYKQVERDVIEGLQEYLEPMDFQVVELFNEVEVLIDGDIAAVQWVFEGFDCCGGLNGMWPTGKSVLVRGLTLVDSRDDEWRFSRHVDWNSVNSQLGGSSGRNSAPIRHANFKDAKSYAVKCKDARLAEIAKGQATATNSSGGIATIPSA